MSLHSGQGLPTCLLLITIIQDVDNDDGLLLVLVCYVSCIFTVQFFVFGNDEKVRPFSKLTRFRPYVAKLERMARSHDEEREMELERNARMADLEVVLAKLERDIQNLEQRLSAAGSESERHAKDLQYLRQRQKTPVLNQTGT